MVSPYAKSQLPTSMSKNADSTCRKIEENSRRTAAQAIILDWGTKLAPIVPPKTLTDSHVRFLLISQSYLNSKTGTPKSLPYIIILERYTLILIHWWTVYAILLLWWSSACFFYIVELYPTFSQCRALHNPNTLLRYNLCYYIAEHFPILTHCWGIPYHNTLLISSKFQYNAELYPILRPCWSIRNIFTLLR